MMFVHSVILLHAIHHIVIVCVYPYCELTLLLMSKQSLVRIDHFGYCLPMSQPICRFVCKSEAFCFPSFFHNVTFLLKCIYSKLQYMCCNYFLLLFGYERL